jgi:RecA-family ATPase
MLTNLISERRIRYIKAGYEPIPCVGKRPAPANWSKMSIDIDAPPAWDATYPNATNTGIRTRRAPAVDIDIYDAVMADRIEDALRATVVPQSLRRRIGKPPKRLIPFRCETPFAKIRVKFRAPGDDKTIHTIEVLADGQQYIAEGIHPDTGQPYVWEGGELLTVARGHLPLIDEAMARRFIAEASAMMIAAGWIEVDDRGNPKIKGGKQTNGTTKSNGTAANIDSIYYRSALRDECDALAAMPKDSGRNNALNRAAFNLFQLVASSALDENLVRERLFAAAEACGLVADDGAASVLATIESGARAGRQHPRQAPDHGGDQGNTQGSTTPRPALVWIDMSNWDSIPVPKREWLVSDRIPIRQPTLFSGEGAVGKSLLTLHLLASIALGRDWLGMVPELGPAWYVGAEDDVRELHIRLSAIQKYLGVSFAELIDAGFRMKSLFGEDAVLGAPNRFGIIEPTELYKQIYDAAADVKPKCIAIDASADVFAGDEVNRSQVRQFVGLLRKLAGVCDGAVILLSHPSLTGINSGTGLSGSTAWHNSVRARMYLTSPKTEVGEQPDSDLRELTFKKNNYGPIGESTFLRWKDGLFLPEAGLSFEAAAAEQKADDIFLRLLARFIQNGQNVSHKPQPANYAPRRFAKEPEAKSLTRPKLALEQAMHRLFREQRIHVQTYGRFGYERLALGAKP